PRARNGARRRRGCPARRDRFSRPVARGGPRGPRLHRQRPRRSAARAGDTRRRADRRSHRGAPRSPRAPAARGGLPRARPPPPPRFPHLERSLRALTAADCVPARLAAVVPFCEELRAHMNETTACSVTRGQVLKRGARLHDVATPETRRLVQGRVRFFDHDVVGAERARAIGRRLRLPERALGVLERLVRHHLRPMHLGASGRLTNRARSRFHRDLREDTQDLLLLALADAAAVTGTSPWSVWRRALLIRDLLGGWQELQAIEAAPPLLRGEDVMHRLGLAPGPAVGRALARVREAQALGRLKTRDEALAYLDSLSADP